MALVGTFTPSAGAIDTGASSIPSGGTSLYIVLISRTDRAANATDILGVQFNADTGANYNNVNNAGNSTTSGSSSTGATTSINTPQTAGATATASVFGSMVIEIPGYAGAQLKTAKFHGGLAGSGTVQSAVLDGFWNSTAAITRIKVLSTNAANLIAGSTMSVYTIT